MKRKCIFGGTFDPIHIGHLNVAYEAMYQKCLSEVIFLPAAVPPHKISNYISSSNHRINMIEISLKDEPLFLLDTYEIHKGGINYTYQTIEQFINKENDVEWYFLMGGDSLLEFPSWRNVELILNKIKLLVYPRAEEEIYDLIKAKDNLTDKYKGHIEILKVPRLDISSTMIRKLIAEGKKTPFITKETYDYIKKNKLYIVEGDANG